MTAYKILVEFELDPTEYASLEAEAQPDGVNVEPYTITMPDTLEAAKTLVQKMFEGEVDICSTRMVGDLLLLFRGRGSPAKGDSQQHQQIINTIILTLQKFKTEKPFQKVTGPLSITAMIPTATRPYYEVCVWRQPGSDLVIDE